MSFLSLFSLLCQKRQEPKSGYYNFLGIYPPPTKNNGISLSDSLLREKLGVLLIVLLTEAC